MASALFFLLLAAVVFLAAFAVYMLLRIVGVYRKARRLERMRNYETILYASLQELGPRRALRLLPRPDPEALEEVLLRMAGEGTGMWREMVVELYGLCGFAASRRNELRSRLAGRRSRAARRLGRVGDAAAAPELERLLGDRSGEVRAAAAFALQSMAAVAAPEKAPAAGGELAPARGTGAENGSGRARSEHDRD